jgi:hypothetical protein
MSTAVKLDMMPSEEIFEYAQKAMLNNPFENFKLKIISMLNYIRVLLLTQA